MQQQTWNGSHKITHNQIS